MLLVFGADFVVVVEIRSTYTNKTSKDKVAAKKNPPIKYAAIDKDNKVAKSLKGGVVLLGV